MGIFSGGINSVIQALARQRKKGEIHIILSKPYHFNYQSLLQSNFTENQLNNFKFHYNLVKHYNSDIIKISYISQESQDYLTLKFYKEKLHYDVHEEIRYINSQESERLGLPSLRFPDYKSFKLNKGEDYLARTFHFFGRDLSSYITYSALTNQFMNCKLEKMYFKKFLFFYEGRVQQDLENYFNQYFDQDYYSIRADSSNFQRYYDEFRNELFQNFTLKYQPLNSQDWKTINPFNNKDFEIEILKFVAKKFYGSKYYNEGQNYSRSLYLMDCIQVSRTLNIEYPDEVNNKKKLYLIIDHFRMKLIENLGYYSSSLLKYYYLPNKPSPQLFNEYDFEKFEDLKELIQLDPLLKNNIFDFNRGISIMSFYNKLIEDFFETEPVRLPTGRRKNVKKVTSIKLLPLKKEIVNLIDTPKDYYFIDQEYIIQAYGTLDNYNDEQESINDLLENHLRN